MFSLEKEVRRTAAGPPLTVQWRYIDQLGMVTKSYANLRLFNYLRLRLYGCFFFIMMDLQ